MAEERKIYLKYEKEGKQRLDHFLVEELPEFTRSFIQNLVKNGRVSVSGEIVEKSGLKLEQPRNLEIIVSDNCSIRVL